MKMRNREFYFLIASVFIILGYMYQPAEAAQDPRFFGTYCGSLSGELEVKVKFLGITVGRKRARINVAINADAGYRESARRNGLVFGDGKAEVASVVGDEEIRSRVAEGTLLPFTFSGVVVRRGVLDLTARAPEHESYNTEVTLSADGERLTIPVASEAISISGIKMNIPPGFAVVLGKDLCSNHAPTARIVAPSATDFLWGEPISFRATASDTEDSSFAPERLIWSSDKDGRMGTGMSLRKNFLSPGAHTITFTAADSGGRAATAEKRIVIQNNPPRAPRITSPSGRTFYVGQEITFRGWAQDRESGDLVGDALVWRSSLVSSPLGTGELVKTTLPEGVQTITLTATDRDGFSSSASISLTVLPLPAGNTPPLVAITSPSDRAGMGDGECMTLVAEAEDLQDGVLTGDSLVWRGSYIQGGSVRTRNLGRGERVEMCNPPTTGHDTWHTITVEARDSGGLRSMDTIKIYVIPGGLI